MTTPINRILLLSLGIAVLMTAVFYWFKNESSIKIKSKKPAVWAATITIQPEVSNDPTREAALMEGTMPVIEERLKAMDWDYTLKPAGKGRIVSINKVTDTNSVIELLTGNGHFSMMEVYTLGNLGTFLMNADTFLAKQLGKELQDTLEQRATYSPGHPILSVMQIPAVSGYTTYFPGHIGMVKQEDTGLLRRLLEDTATLARLPDDIVFTFGEDINNMDPTGILKVYAIRNRPPRITNKDIVTAKADYGVSGSSGDYAITTHFNARATEEWAQMTTRNVGKPIAMWLNGRVVCAPIVNAPITGGASTISLYRGNGLEYCQVLCILLTSKDLPLTIRVQEARFSPAGHLFSPFLAYIIVFIVSFALAMGVQWLIMRLNKI